MAGGLVQSYSFRDAKGNTSRLSLFFESGTGTTAQLQSTGLAISADLGNLSNAAVYKAIGPYTNAAASVAYGNVATYEDVEDKAILTFDTTTGALHRYQIPAPISALFLADGETVDPANANLKQLVADMLVATYLGTAPAAGAVVHTVSRDNLHLADFIGGTRIRRKLHRRFNIYTKNPALTGPGE